MHAVRNIVLCNKDCICLYVCPTGATDTPTGQVDAEICIGCGSCAAACPSHAISMVPEQYPPQQKKKKSTVDNMFDIAKSKTEQEQSALKLSQNESNPNAKQFLNAIAMSNRIMSEDIMREAGFMLPQSYNTHKFLLSILKSEDKDLPKEAVEKLLNLLQVNDAPNGYNKTGEK